MSDALALRPITPDDAALIARLHTESWRSAYRGILLDAFLDGDLLAERERTWHERLTTGFGVGWVVERDGAAAGFTFVRRERDVRWGLWVDNLHVRPALKGRGTGRVLLGAVAEYAATLAASHGTSRAAPHGTSHGTSRAAVHEPDMGIWLWVYADNAPARAFYERVGGDVVETVPMLSPDGRMLPECRVAWKNAQALQAGVSARTSAA